MLLELQAKFARSLLEHFRAPAPSGLIAGDAARAAARFMVHRGNVAESLANALGHTFPAVKAVCGEGNFRILAVGYARASPPRRPHLMSYGAGFADFVGAHAEAMRDFPFLADLARLEWAMNECYFAADAPVLTPGALGAIPEERLAGLRLAFHPAAHLVTSARFPVHAIMTAALAGESLPDPISEGGDAVLVTRANGSVEAHRLRPGEFDFLGAVAAGASLEKAVEAAVAAEADFDLAAALADALSRGVFSAEISFD